MGRFPPRVAALPPPSLNRLPCTSTEHSAEQPRGVFSVPLAMAAERSGTTRTTWDRRRHLGDFLRLTPLRVAFQRDQAQSGDPQYTEVTALLTQAEDPGTSDDFADNFSAALEDIDAVCVNEDEDKCADANQESETEIELVATADADGAFSDPFERVDFWMQDVNGAAWFLGSDTPGESGRVGGDGADARRRTWTYSMEFPAAMLYMMTREAAFPVAADSDSHTVRVFGVNSDGVAYALSGTVTIDDGDGDN